MSTEPDTNTLIQQLRSYANSSRNAMSGKSASQSSNPPTSPSKTRCESWNCGLPSSLVSIRIFNGISHTLRPARVYEAEGAHIPRISAGPACLCPHPPMIKLLREFIQHAKDILVMSKWLQDGTKRLERIRRRLKR